MSTSRKKFLRGLAAGTIGLPIALRLLLGEGKAQYNDELLANSGQRYEWKMVTTWPPGFPILGEGCNLLADLVRVMSGGRLNIEVYGGGELVPALGAFDAVQQGAAQLGSGSPYYWAGKIPAAQFFSGYPFGLNAQQMNAWLIAGGGLELWQELYAEFGMVPFVGGNTGVQMGGWYNREINTVADFQGLKMRMPGLGGRVLEALGGTPVLLAGGEIYTGLERGVIDATEWVGPYHDYIMGFHEITKYYYYPGWHEPGTAFEFFANQ
ncbi:MAG: TRAP transporter substrate-binding protein, partial [Bacteroidota bacterium]